MPSNVSHRQCSGRVAVRLSRHKLSLLGYVCHLFAVALGDKSAQMMHMKHQMKESTQKKVSCIHANSKVENVHPRRKCSIFSDLNICLWMCVDKRPKPA